MSYTKANNDAVTAETEQLYKMLQRNSDMQDHQLHVRDAALNEFANNDCEFSDTIDPNTAEILAERNILQSKPTQAYPFMLYALHELNSISMASDVLDFIKYRGMDFTLEDRMFALAVSEQYFVKKHSKALCKIVKQANPQEIAILNACDHELLYTAVGNCLFQARALGLFSKITLRLEQNLQKLPISGSADILILSIVTENANDASLKEYFGQYLFFPRSKKINSAKYIADVTATVSKLAAELIKNESLPRCDVSILGNTTTISNKGEATTNRIAAKKAEFDGKKGSIQTTSYDVNVTTAQTSLFSDGSSASSSDALQDSALDNVNSKITINESLEESLLTAMTCSQCGGSITASAHDGETVVCKFCGSAFILNKNALGKITSGIDYQSMLADKPKSAELPKLEYLLKSLFDGKLGVIMPSNFGIMDDKIKAIKYPRGCPPQFVFTDETGKTNFTFTVQYSLKLSDNQTHEYGNAARANLIKMLPSSTFGDAGTFTSCGKTIYFMDFISTAADTDIYNYMMFFSLSGHLVTASFNCVAEDRWFWLHIFKLAGRSLKFDD